MPFSSISRSPTLSDFEGEDADERYWENLRDIEADAPYFLSMTRKRSEGLKLSQQLTPIKRSFNVASKCVKL